MKLNVALVASIAAFALMTGCAKKDAAETAAPAADAAAAPAPADAAAPAPAEAPKN